MTKDFLRFVKRPSDLLSALRAIAFGGAIAAVGVTPTSGVAAERPLSVPAPTVAPLIVDRSRKAPKLILRLPGAATQFRAEHRSHSSHRSHYSSSTGGGSTSAPAPRAPAAPTPTPTPTPRSAPATATSLGLVSSPGENLTSGEVVLIDTDARTLDIRESATVRTKFAYRDDSKFKTSLGVLIRFDDFSDANSGKLPIATREKVQILWRMSTDGKTRIVTTVRKQPE